MGGMALAMAGGLFILALNGLQLIKLDQRARELAAREEDIKRLLMRLRLRNKG